MKNKKIVGYIVLSLLLVVLVTSTVFIFMGGKKTILLVFNAGSLTLPIEKLSDTYELTHPNIKIEHESAGSAVSIRKITEQGRSADLLLSADYSLIDTMMIANNSKWANWSIVFAKNSLVIAYTTKSQYFDVINSTNWYNYVARDNSVKSAHSNPADDPCGYRTLLTVKLASIYYNDSTIWDKISEHPSFKTPYSSGSIQLLSALELGEIDYAFIYKSEALQYGLSFIELDDHINLGNIDYNAFYKNATVYFDSITGVIKDGPGDGISSKTGKAIWYGLTIPNNAPHYKEALDFVKFILSNQGLDIIESQAFQPIIKPPQTKDLTLIPEELRTMVIVNPEL